METKPRDSITVDYYTSTLLTSIVQFIKRVAKPTPLENCEEAIVVKKNLCTIGLIKDDEPTKESKNVSRKSQTMVRKGRDKEENDIETLTCLVKNLITKVFELKQWKMNTFARNYPPRHRQGSKSLGNNWSTQENVHNSIFNFDQCVDLEFCLFHKEHHPENFCSD